ncbi:hypothetical protein A2U01_0047824, partial [Trifolium medium]|nr:hypothetical protein [Trifolium medium]
MSSFTSSPVFSLIDPPAEASRRCILCCIFMPPVLPRVDYTAWQALQPILSLTCLRELSEVIPWIFVCT